MSEAVQTDAATDAGSVQTARFRVHDGLDLFYQYRVPTAPRGAVVLLHRGHEHSGRMLHVADELGLPDLAYFAYDARGLGQSPGVRGDAPDFATLVRDLETFVTHIQQHHGIARADIVVVAQSVGAVVASAWAHDYAPKIRGLVLASPAFSVKLYVPFARPGLALLHQWFGNFFVNSYVKARFLTHDAVRIQSYEQDPLITRPISVRILLGLYEAADRVVADSSAILLPTQLLISGADWVVRAEPQHRFFAGLANPRKECHVFKGLYHDTLGERDRAPVMSKMRTFIKGLFEQPTPPLDVCNADRLGPTFDEAQALAKPLPAWSPRAWYWSVTRLGLRVGAWVSKGLALGQETGFDSGSTLDYIYQNQARGWPILGTLIDRVYLNAIGWRGIRIRKLHLEELLHQAVNRLHQQRQPVRLVDIAAGHGRYVVDAVKRLTSKPDHMLLRDYSERNVRDGQALINAAGLGSRAHFALGDAFDRENLAALVPAPTLAIVSGLYELFPDNHAVAQSLAGLADVMPRGSYLIYTCQPWHPQLELIARALTSHRQGQAWVMRRRSQAEMDQLVAAAGFEKVEQRIDSFGIFTVSLAFKQ
ncbi:hypothetical protein C7S18_07145 [Ahniella affigens]|uniref:Uncharacterized protein n=1 Tax=Ahniella affigens TaxID=2021234 RepID=A0A2P1PQ62_9GAMM|nr:hypothetical protein C7S18_07145 [Ahniella affigens]